MTDLFSPASIDGLTFDNRCLVAPMTRVSGTEEGLVGPLMRDYYRAFGTGGFAGIITEGVYTDKAHSQCYRNQPGIVDKSQQDSWKPLIGSVRETGAVLIMQLMHAGALSQFNRYRTHARAPSAVTPRGEQMSFYHGEGPYPTPQAMTAADIEEAVSGFVEAGMRALDAGANGVEVHGANGYLLDQFLTDYTNTRKDAYGGDAKGRVRLTCEIIERLREKLGSAATIGVRISQAKVNDYEHKWKDGAEDAEVIFSRLKEAGASYIHTTEFNADAPAFETGPSLAQHARSISGLPVIANGNLDVQRAQQVIAEGAADMVAIGKGALAAQDWPRYAQNNLQPPAFDFGMFSPFADLQSAAEFRARQAKSA
ncbi:NADH:flavin oxidoreductase [Roseibium sp. SCP14]|uniref:NADH:flavin oxidoreductase n=1 Tax=Roseibium sp. SCP14 TaxID=3141375 RepID=UPI00333E1610